MAERAVPASLLLTPEAELDLEEIADYIAVDNPARAVSFVQEIRDRCIKIGNAPLAYVARPELGEALRRSFALLRPANGDASAQDQIRQVILDAYTRLEAAS